MKEKEKQALEERYPDLLNEGRNPELAQLVDNLDSAYSAPRSPEYLTWTNLKTQHIQIKIEQQRSLPRALFRPTARPAARISIILAAVLLMLLVVGTAYAQVSGLLEDVLNMDPGTQHLAKSNQFVNTDISQTMQGYTVTVQKAYADSDRIIIGYTIKTPTDHTYQVLADGQLYTDQAQNPSAALTQIDGEGSASADGHTLAYIAGFDASRIQGNPDTINLKLVINQIQGYIADGLPDKANHMQKTGSFHPPLVSVSGHIQFALSVPFHKGFTIHVGQQQAKIILDHVAIAQSATRIYLQGVSYDQFNVANLTVSNGNGTKQYTWQSADSEAYPGGTIITFPYPLANSPGNWTLTLTPGTPLQKSGDTQVFHFTIPQQ